MDVDEDSEIVIDMEAVGDSEIEGLGVIEEVIEIEVEPDDDEEDDSEIDGIGDKDDD